MESAALAELMTETGWLRRLARSLVGDAAADDLVQDTVLVAAEHAPTDGRPLRPWLARVLTNLARMSHRGAARRTAREHASEAPAAAARPDELVERVQTQQLLAQLVLALPEPQRDVVLLHYVEGLTSPQIAARLGIADGIARWRLKQALDELRARLDARTPRRAWIASVGVLTRSGSRATAVGAAAAGGLLVKNAVIALVLVILVILVAVVGWPRAHDPRGVEASRVVAASRPPASTEGPNLAASGLPAWLATSGTHAVHLAGHVTLGGTPLTHATVTLYATALLDSAVVSVETGLDGAFDLGMRPAIAYQLAASAPDKTPTLTDIVAADPHARPTPDAIELDACRAVLSGLVTDASNTPLVGATVRVRGRQGVETDAHGAYSLCVPTFDTQVVVTAVGYGAIAPAIRLDGNLHRDFALSPEGTLAGRIVDDATNEPVANAYVRATPASAGIHAQRATTTGADGTFVLEGLAPGLYELAARAPGLGGGSPMVTVRATMTTPAIELRLHALSAIRGVARSEGRPVAGARIELGAKRALHALVEPVFTDDTGHFVLAGVPRGRTELTAAPYGVESPAEVLVDRDVVEVELVLMRSHELRGHVMHDGAPVGGAEVTCSIPGSYGASVVTTADASGEYHLAVPKGDRCYLVAASPRLALFSSGHEVTLAADHETVVDLELDAAASIAGTVVDGTGAPVAGVYVTFESESGDYGDALTDGHGAFSACCMIGGGTYHPHVWPTAAQGVGLPTAAPLAPIKLATSATVVRDVRLVVDARRETIRGIVVDEAGVQIADATVIADGPAMPMRGPFGAVAPVSALTDEHGAFELTGLAASTYVVKALAADGGEGSLAAVVAGSRSAVVTVARAGAIEGTLEGFGTAPYVIVRGRADGDSRVQRAFLDGTHFWARGLRPGPYVVSVQDDHGAAMQAVEVHAGETLTLDLHASGTTTIAVTVREWTTKQPVAGTLCQSFAALAGVAAFADQPPSNTQRTAANGLVTISNAPVGRVRIECFDGPASDGSAETTLIAGRTGTVTVEVVAHPAQPSDPGLDFEYRVLPPLVFALEPGGSAERAGLRVQDRVLAVDGTAVTSLARDALLELLASHAPGSSVMLGIERGGKVLAVPLVLGVP